MTRSTLLVLAPLTAAVTFGLLSAVGPESSTPAVSEHSGISCVDDLGRTVTLEAPAERVAVISPFAVDVLLDLGVEPVLVPEMLSEQPVSWEGLATLEVSHSSGPNFEQIAASGADLVIASKVYARFIPVLERTLGLPVACLDVESIDDVMTEINAIACLVGREDAGAELAEQMQREIDAVTRDAPTDGPSVYAMFGMREANYAFLPDSYLGSLIETLGGRLLTKDAQVHPVFEGFTPLSMETVIAGEPDIVLVVAHGAGGGVVRSLEEDPAWSGVGAVQDGRISRLPEDVFVMAPGTRPAEALDMLKDAMYPERD